MTFLSSLVLPLGHFWTCIASKTFGRRFFEVCSACRNMFSPIVVVTATFCDSGIYFVQCSKTNSINSHCYVQKGQTQSKPRIGKIQTVPLVGLVVITTFET